MTLKEDYMPNWYDNVLEMQILLDASQVSLDELQSRIDQVRDNQYIRTADLKTISLYEKMLNMQVDSSESLDVRRYKVLTKLAIQKPYTTRYIMDLIGNSSESLSVEMFYDEYRMLISIDVGRDESMSELQYLINLIRTLVPANINVQSQMKQYIEFRQSRTYHFINYHYVGDYLTGEHPNIAKLGDINNIDVELNQDSTNHIFKPRLTGEYPKIAKFGDINKSKINLNQNIQGHIVKYRMHGKAGEYPQTSTSPDLNDGTFAHVADVDTHKVPYKFAGEEL